MVEKGVAAAGLADGAARLVEASRVWTASCAVSDSRLLPRRRPDVVDLALRCIAVWCSARLPCRKGSYESSPYPDDTTSD
jgi:hypothetical protein